MNFWQKVSNESEFLICVGSLFQKLGGSATHNVMDVRVLFLYAVLLYLGISKYISTWSLRLVPLELAYGFKYSLDDQCVILCILAYNTRI